MSLLRVTLCSLILAGWAGRLMAGELPPINGELSGEITALKLSGAPPLAWRVVFRGGGGAGQRNADLVVEAPGLRLAGEATMRSLADGAWRLAESRVEVARWAPVLTRELNLPASLDADGVLHVEGAGEIRDGALSGRLQLDLRDAAVRDSTSGWSIEGLALRGALASVPSLASEGRSVLSFKQANVGGILISEGAIEFAIDGDRRLHVASATASVMGGRVAMAPFAVALDRPEVKTDVHFSSIELGGLAQFLPPMLAEARGPVSGNVQLSWTLADGLALADGALRPRPAETASVTLAPNPGFLTSRLPEFLGEYIEILPKWFGPIRGLFRPKNPAYATLRDIELGRIPLEVQTFEIHLDPEGDGQGRTGHFILMAKPMAEGSAVDSVRLEININGPLADLVRLALERRIRVRAR